MTNFAGPMNNFILAIIVYTILTFVVGGVTSNNNRIDPTSSGVTIARDAGIKNGDYITAVNGTKVKTWDGLATQIQKRANKKTTLTIKRDDATKQVTLTPKAETVQKKTVGQIGITQYHNHAIGAMLLSGFTQTWDMTKRLIGAIWSMVSGHFSLNDLGGPVAIFATTSTAASEGIAGVLNFLAFLSLNLGIVNLLPIPALDGGKILLNVIEGIRRKPLPESVETGITLVGVVFLVILMVLVTWNDIERYFIR